MATPHPLTRAERAAAIDYYLAGSNQWVVDAARSAPNLSEAADALRKWFAPMRAGSFSPIGRSAFEYDTTGAGVQFWRNAPGEDWDGDSPPAATITWREMAEHVRATAVQLEMFA